VPGLRLGSPSHLAEAWRRDITDAWGEGMTEEETTRFALVLKECERISAMIAKDETEEGTLAVHAGGQIPIVVAPVKEQVAVPPIITAA
jgi:hypothetical protein